MISGATSASPNRPSRLCWIRVGWIRLGWIRPGWLRPATMATFPRTPCCGWAPRATDGQLALRLRYRTDVLDADGAARIAGYHLTALELMAADLDAEHRRQSLLSAEELHFQLEGLAGPRRELPDRRVHELFEQQVEAHPDAVAAVQGARQWTYRELNGRANRLARAAVGARAGPRSRRRGGDRAQPGLDGRGAGDLQGRWGVSADRAALSRPIALRRCLPAPAAVWC